MSVKQNLFLSVFVHECLIMLNDVVYTTFKMFVTKMSNYLFVISFQLMLYEALRHRLARALKFICKNFSQKYCSHIIWSGVRVHHSKLLFQCLRSIARITSSVQAFFILCVFLGSKASNFVNKVGCYRCLKSKKFEGFDRESRPRPC